MLAALQQTDRGKVHAGACGVRAQQPRWWLPWLPGWRDVRLLGMGAGAAPYRYRCVPQACRAESTGPVAPMLGESPTHLCTAAAGTGSPAPAALSPRSSDRHTAPGGSHPAGAAASHAAHSVGQGAGAVGRCLRTPAAPQGKWTLQRGGTRLQYIAAAPWLLGCGRALVGVSSDARQ